MMRSAPRTRGRYGTDIGRIGKRLLEDRYDKRTHFIFELLQNAEDALRRRKGWTGDRAVRFELTTDALRISHFGEPFDAGDVVGICGIDQTHKGLTSIGRFGIGFKSVYAFTARPGVHSGNEAFGIESYVWPFAVPPVQRRRGETMFVLPFRPRDTSATPKLRKGFGSLARGRFCSCATLKSLPGLRPMPEASMCGARPRN